MGAKILKIYLNVYLPLEGSRTKATKTPAFSSQKKLKELIPSF